MLTDTELQLEGCKALIERLGNVQAEKFITLILREPFDYTKWRQNLWPDLSIEQISSAAMAYQQQLTAQLEMDSRK